MLSEHGRPVKRTQNIDRLLEELSHSDAVFMLDFVPACATTDFRFPSKSDSPFHRNLQQSNAHCQG